MEAHLLKSTIATPMLRKAIKKTNHRKAAHHLLAWVRAPLRVGALLPSSRALGHAMASEVDLSRPGAVVELGAGTGAITHALLQAGVPPERLVVVERDRKLHAVMSSQFPSLNILCADAIDLDRVLKSAGTTRIAAIVSSLPLLSMPKSVRLAIQHQMASVIGHDALLIQFTYGPRAPIPRQLARQYHLRGRRMRLVVANLPPAHVWVYKKG